MRPFSFGKQRVEKISFSQNIKKLTFAIPIFAILIAIPALLFFNYRIYSKEVQNLTDDLIRDSREDVENQVHLLCKQITAQQTTIDSILKNTLNRQSQEIELIAEQLGESTYTETKKRTLSKLIYQGVALRKNINIALFDAKGDVLTSDSTATKLELFEPLSSAIRFYREDPHSLLEQNSTPFSTYITQYTIHPIANSSLLLVAGITKNNKRKLQKEMTLSTTLTPLLRNLQELTFVLNSSGEVLLSNRINSKLKRVKGEKKIKQALEFPQGLYSIEHDKNGTPTSILFTVYLKEFDWIIGSSISLDSIHSIFIKTRKKILWQFLNQFLIMSSVVLLMMLLSMWYGKRLASRMTNEFSAFMNSFYSLVKNRRGLQSNTFLYEEFDDIIQRVVNLTQDLKGSEKRFREMAELLPVMLFECDTTGLITYVNPAAEDIFEYKTSEVVNRYTFDFFTPEDKEKIIENIESRAVGKMNNKPRYYTAIKSSGAEFNVMIHANNITINGKIVGIRGIITDVSDQIENEKRLKEMYDESESLNRLMAKREKRVFEMKLEVNTLLKEAGLPIKYMATENLFREEHVQG